MKFRSYIRLLACLIGIGSVAVVGLNWIIDPFYIFESPRITGLNAAKTGFFKHLRFMKPLVLEVRRNTFDTVILGSSRAEAGLDPEHPAWDGSRVYNLSIPAPSMYELLRYYEFADEVQDLRTVVLALDFAQFDLESKVQSDYEVDRLLESIHASNRFNLAGNLTTALFSTDALLASVRTVMSQRDPQVEHTPLGFGIHAWRRLEVSRVGQRAMFMDNDRQYIANHWTRNGLAGLAIGGAQAQTLVYFRRFVEECRTNGTTLIVFISPSHAREWSSVWAAGLWPQVEQWKRDLVAILADDDVRHPGKAPAVLWDFSGYNSITTEEVPQTGDTNTEMKWYWEGSHFKKEVGDLMLEKILDYPNPAHSIPHDFGVRLTSVNIEEHLQTIRDQQSAWHRQHQQDLQEIIELVKVSKNQVRHMKEVRKI